MPFSNLIQRSFEIVWRNRSLWIVGMLFAFFGGGSSSGGSGGGGGGGGGGGSGTFPGSGDAPTMPELPAWLTMEFVVTAVIVVVAIAFILGIVGLVIRSIIYAGLIEGTNLAIEGQKRGWREILGAGWRGRWKSLVGLELLIALPGIILGLLALCYVLTLGMPFIQAAISGDRSALNGMEDAFAATFFGGFCLFFCLIFVVLITQWVLTMAGKYASRAIVVEGQPLRSGWQQGWQLFRENILNTIIMSILLAILLGIIGFVIAIPLLIIGAFAIVPLFALFQNPSAIPVPVWIIGGIGVVLGFSVIGSVLSGPLLAYSETVWTMTYRYLTGRGIPPAPESPAPTATPVV